MIIPTLMVIPVYLLTWTWGSLIIVVGGTARPWTSTRRPSPLLTWSHSVRTSWCWLHIYLLYVIICLLAAFRCMLPVDWGARRARWRHGWMMVIHHSQSIVWRHRLRIMILGTSTGAVRKLMMSRWTTCVTLILALDHPRYVLLWATLVSNYLNGSVAEGR